jgi:dienelactone hydrolase
MNRDQMRSTIGRLIKGKPVQSDGPERWIDARRAWRYSNRIGRRQVDLLLRARSAGNLPGMGRERLAAMSLPRDAVEQALHRIRSVAGWYVAWTATAQTFLAETRGANGTEEDAATARARGRAALAYHAASWLAYDDPATMRMLRAARSSLFARSVPLLLPRTELVRIPWRAAELPAYLRFPVLAEAQDRPIPLVVILNGATTAKEETVLWTDAFVERGLAVLALDQPGTGEAVEVGPPSGEHDDLLDGVRDMVALDPRLDGSRIALIGFSLGGAQAVRIAAHDRRLAACVAVTPPFEPGAWLYAANPLMLDQLAGHLGGPYIVMELAEGFDLPEMAAWLRCPLLVLGAGHDLIVPPSESQRLAAAAGDLGTLLWYPRASHGLYEIMSTWTTDVAAWLGTILDEPRVALPERPSTRVDARPQLSPDQAAEPVDSSEDVEHSFPREAHAESDHSPAN